MYLGIISRVVLVLALPASVSIVKLKGIYFSSMRTIYCAIFIIQMVRNFIKLY